MYREEVLAKAWREVKANAGSAGVDGQTIEQIEEQGVEGLLAELATELGSRHRKRKNPSKEPSMNNLTRRAPAGCGGRVRSPLAGRSFWSSYCPTDPTER